MHLKHLEVYFHSPNDFIIITGNDIGFNDRENKKMKSH